MGKELIIAINKSSVSTLERGKHERKNQEENPGIFLRKGGI